MAKLPVVIEAIARVDNNADDAWKADADLYIGRIADERLRFTGEDIWALGLPPPPGPSCALGPRLLAAERRGIIKRTNEWVPSRKQNNHRDVKVWVSLVCPEEIRRVQETFSISLNVTREDLSELIEVAGGDVLLQEKVLSLDDILVADLTHRAVLYLEEGMPLHIAVLKGVEAV